MLSDTHKRVIEAMQSMNGENTAYAIGKVANLSPSHATQKLNMLANYGIVKVNNGSKKLYTLSEVFEKDMFTTYAKDISEMLYAIMDNDEDLTPEGILSALQMTIDIIGVE
tara:strand:- start:1337 stop:1669 length:333 start_codon:yes stop_codon:yes gene_type:complete